MARQMGAREWQVAYRYQNAFEAKQRAAVDLQCEPYEVEIAPYAPDANQNTTAVPVPRAGAMADATED